MQHQRPPAVTRDFFQLTAALTGALNVNLTLTETRQSYHPRLSSPSLAYPGVLYPL